jgi:hypothetical protein
MENDGRWYSYSNYSISSGRGMHRFLSIDVVAAQNIHPDIEQCQFIDLQINFTLPSQLYFDMFELEVILLFCISTL